MFVTLTIMFSVGLVAYVIGDCMGYERGVKHAHKHAQKQYNDLHGWH